MSVVINPPDFSIQHREKVVRQLKEEIFDLIIIGGGITGAGIALDAASRGLRTALLEKNDFAFGTSSRSTKLIHGGLRYLKQLEFGLVKEVGSERAVVHNLAPHLVHPEKMLLPLSEKRGLGYWAASIGLRVYDYLAGVKREDERRMLTRPQTLKLEPLLRPEDVKGGAIYAEYRTDDARLTIEIIKAAVLKNAIVANYARVNDFIYANTKINGVQAFDVLTNEAFIVRGKAIVSAAGPWVDQLREINNSRIGKKLHLTKGVHIVVAHERLPVKQAIYFSVDDGRMIFAIPRGRITYIGTTDTTYTGDPDRVVTDLEDARYLIDAVNANFPQARLEMKDIESSWAGLRPLIHEEGKSTSGISRKDEIFESETGLISIAGGKLTGYRKMSERVVNLVIRKHFPDQRFKKCHTQSLYLPGGTFKDDRDVKRFIDDIAAKYKLPQSTAIYLVQNYGRQSEIIAEEARTMASDLSLDWRLIKAELSFTVKHEMVATATDFFVRRTGLIYFDIHKVLFFKDQILGEMQQMLRWDKSRVELEMSALEDAITSARSFEHADAL